MVVVTVLSIPDEGICHYRSGGIVADTISRCIFKVYESLQT